MSSALLLQEAQWPPAAAASGSDDHGHSDRAYKYELVQAFGRLTMASSNDESSLPHNIKSLPGGLGLRVIRRGPHVVASGRAP
jgi:hypothetical protein